MSFASMKKKRGNFSDLQSKLETDNKKNFTDDRSYYPQLDESKNGSAIIRFLPAADGDNDQPWVKVYSHGFKDLGGWYIEECPTTIANDCPVCTENQRLWATGLDSDKEIARKRKRRLQYVANVLVVEDKKNPEKEGKVFLFKFGMKIFDKIKDSMFPAFDDETPVNVFDPWDGANFRLKIRKFEGMTNYDKSSFDSPTPMLEGNDKKIEEIWNQQYKLTDEISDDKFKPFDDLNKRYARVVGGLADTTTASEMANAVTAPSVDKSSEPASAPTVEPETDEALDFLRKLAED